MRVLGVDYGDVRTGIAISDPTGFLAGGLMTIRETYDLRLADEIVSIASKNGVERIVLGNPVNMDGSEGFRSEHAKALKALLEERTEIPVILFDERCTTQAAHTIMNLTDTRGKKRKAAVDTLSAEIILQNYLDKMKNTR